MDAQVRKIKVAFFAETLVEDVDGAVRTMFQLISRIDAEKFEFLFIYGTGPERIAGFKIIKVPAVTLPVNTNYTVALPVLAKVRLKASLDAFAADVIHIATPSLLGNFGLSYALQNQLPVITIYHTHFVSYVDYYLKHIPVLINSVKRIIIRNNKFFYNKCSKVYIPSDSIREELNNNGIDSQKMKMWKRGVDTSLFSPRKKDPGFMERLTGNRNPTLLFASRLVWEKNLETLFNIYDEFQTSATLINFVIAGNGSARSACEKRMKKAIFTGKTDHEYLSVLYASSDIFIFPSVSETYGNVVLEAMASGLPCVIANGGGSKDFIEQGINGFKCQPYDTAAYIQKIHLLLQNKFLRDQFVMEGLKYSRKLNWQKLADVYFKDVTDLKEGEILEVA